MREVVFGSRTDGDATTKSAGHCHHRSVSGAAVVVRARVIDNLDVLLDHVDRSEDEAGGELVEENEDER